MRDTSTLAAVLDAHLKEIFKKAVIHLGDPGVPGDTMYYEGIRERTNFGQLLHKEGMWSLYKFEDSNSLLYHLCRGPKGMKLENQPVYPGTGRCVGCETEAPDEIRGLWTLHNFEWVQQGSEFDV